MSKTTYHITEEAEVLFMAARKPVANKYKNNKEEYVIKLKLLEDSETIKHLLEIDPSKVNTDTNRKLEKEGLKEKHVKFFTHFIPTVLDKEGNKLEEYNIPVFDGKVDTAKVKVVYIVKHYSNSKCVRLQGIKILEFNQGPREDLKPVNELIAEIREFLK